MNFLELNKTWIIAEIGVNHEGDFDVAADLVHKAARAGADAVKFQTYQASHYVSSVQPERLARVKRFELSRDDFRRLARLAEERKIVFFSTPLGFDDVDFLDGIQGLFKISSGDITYLPLIRRIAETGKPIILSTGAATRDEIQAAVATILAARPDAGRKGELMLMHCIAAYPAPANEANLHNIEWLRREFGLPTGYSDHTLGTTACEIAASMGAVALEKHFTYRKENQAFHDHAISADPEDLAGLVSRVRTIETYLGLHDRVRGAAEAKNLDNMRRSLAAAVDIPADTPVQPEWVTHLRPAWGLAPHRLSELIGRRLGRAVSAGDLIREEDLS
jgi:N,N'-diacetyllegionaminate synthase